ncbi:hypothetical protein D3C71_1594600 [compost metagenome]
MNPAELLNGSETAGGSRLVHTAVGVRQADAVLDHPVTVAIGLFVLKGETNEIAGWFCFPPVHGKERHAIAAVKLQGEGRVGVPCDNLEFFGHVSFLLKRWRWFPGLALPDDLAEGDQKRSCWRHRVL